MNPNPGIKKDGFKEWIWILRGRFIYSLTIFINITHCWGVSRCTSVTKNIHVESGANSFTYQFPFLDPPLASLSADKSFEGSSSSAAWREYSDGRLKKKKKATVGSIKLSSSTFNNSLSVQSQPNYVAWRLVFSRFILSDCCGKIKLWKTCETIFSKHCNYGDRTAGEQQKQRTIWKTLFAWFYLCWIAVYDVAGAASKIPSFMQ